MRSFTPPSGLPAISPSRGEIGRGTAYANLQRQEVNGTLGVSISPLEGEMPSFGKEGRPEGGAT
ncbi:MAG: propionyl-coenzyme A carboxylase alpha polypeptide [Mesorhizobium sp.]|nr:MAG: propionyl-coenzyme A carboxylase alpha polypeptide [Mesorhizobium sp.]TIQ20991.1 MAG: propionyl-coenzyme A carboxylase alpha polypeptide [Mesorhizobium sp.]TIQ85762.1 MAG: propionyl-coenzyme A carboxylase alpha polypeptide [Mesorhizobium sp.]